MEKKEITNTDLLLQIQENKITIERVQYDIERLIEYNICKSQAIENVKKEVELLQANTKEMIIAFNAAKGAFKVLEWIAAVTKPVVIIVGAISAAYLWSKGFRG